MVGGVCSALGLGMLGLLCSPSEGGDVDVTAGLEGEAAVLGVVFCEFTVAVVLMDLVGLREMAVLVGADAGVALDLLALVDFLDLLELSLPSVVPIPTGGHVTGAYTLDWLSF